MKIILLLLSSAVLAILSYGFFRVNVTDFYTYIENSEKPFDEKIVRENILKALDVPLAEEEERIVFYRKDGIAFSMDPDEIYYIDVRRRSLTVYCVSGVMEVPYKTCKEILKEIGSKFFTQCSRYTIINKRYIEYIDYASRYVKMKGIKEYIEIGAVIKNKFKAEMDEWSF